MQDFPDVNRQFSPFGLLFVALGLVVAVGLGASVVDHVRGKHGGGSTTAAPRWAQVQSILSSNCSACHPGVVSSLNLTPAHSYDSIVGVRAVEDPSLPYVLAGDPAHSYLYLKIAGWPGNGPNPIIGARMPFGRGRLSDADIATIAAWIRGGAWGPTGQTVSANQVATPGNVNALAAAGAPQVSSGDATIAGTITDVNHRPIAGAIVAMLIIRKDLPGGEEHYLAAVTDDHGRYQIHGAPVGRVEIKAYASGTVYVSHLLTTESGATAQADVGLPTQALQNPTISNAQVTESGGQVQLSVDVAGSQLDRNYTLAVNPDSGRVFELRANPPGGETPGTWSRAVPAAGLTGRWVFVAISHLCTVSNMLTVTA
jgi:hypothetical protein